LPWLGQVPAHWRTVRNGSLFGQRSQSGYAELPILEVSLKTGVRVRSFGKAGRKQVMSDLGKYKRAVKGDLAYNTMRMWQGALGVCPADGLVSPAYVVARPYPQVDAGYFAALFRTGDYMAEIDSASRGIVKDRNRLYWDQFKQMRSPCPPLAEQVAIMRFLDWANSRLNRAIRAKRKVITLLNEQRQAIIHRAVTRGIDASVALKPSGISWFDKMPAHWDIRRLTSLATFGAGRAHEQFLTPTGQYVCVTARFVSTSGLVRTHESISSREYRTRLVADVVTGKLDVREAATRLPENAHLLAWIAEPPTKPTTAELTDEEAEA
jgi:type I restriction enzyme S subunit